MVRAFHFCYHHQIWKRAAIKLDQHTSSIVRGLTKHLADLMEHEALTFDLYDGKLHPVVHKALFTREFLDVPIGTGISEGSLEKTKDIDNIKL